MKLFAHTNGDVYEMDLHEVPGCAVVKVGRKSFHLSLDRREGDIRNVFICGEGKESSSKIKFGWTRSESTYRILIDGVVYEVEMRDPRSERALSMISREGTGTGPAEVRAPIPGRITKVAVRTGQKVHADQSLLTLDAMKLENEIQAPRDGTIKLLPVKQGATVDRGELLCVVE